MDLRLSPVEIELRGRRAAGRFAIVDREDAELAKRKWHLDGHFYAICHANRDDGRRTTVALHRLILGLRIGDGLEGDHIDGNRLNNTRANLRVVNHAQQMQNMRRPPRTSSFRGVNWETGLRKWKVQVQTQGVKYYFGLFDSEEEAGRVAAEARKRLMPFAVD